MKNKVKAKRQPVVEPTTESSDNEETEMLVEDTEEQPDSEGDQSIEDDQSIGDDRSIADDEETEAGPSGSAKADGGKKKKGIIYMSSIPKFMNVTILRELLSEFAAIGRIFLQPGKLSSEFNYFPPFLLQKPYFLYISDISRRGDQPEKEEKATGPTLHRRLDRVRKQKSRQTCRGHAEQQTDRNA